MKISTREIFRRFSIYVHEYEQLKASHPEIEVIKIKFSQQELQAWPVLQKVPKALISHLEEMVICLDLFLAGKEAKHRGRILHKVLDDLDLYFNDPRFTNKIFTDIVGVEEFPIFIKPSKFWKAHRGAPVEYSKSFRTFGTFNPRHAAKIIQLDDLLDEYSIRQKKEDGLVRKEKLVVGLFPLSRDYQRLFKITRELNADRRIFGFIGDKFVHESYLEELDRVIDVIKSHEVDIACFPELLISEEAEQYLKDAILKLSKPFFILIAGSDHRALEGANYVNTSPVYIFMKDDFRKANYSKQEAFHVELREMNVNLLKALMQNVDAFISDENLLGSFFKEDMVPEPSILLLSSKDFGDIGVLICKDYLPDSSKIVENYNKIADHMFVISLNFSEKADFNERGKHIAREHGVSLFYVNARSFDHESQSPSFYLTPSEWAPTFIGEQDSQLVYTLMRRRI